MKKLLSVILTISMLISMGTMAVSANETAENTETTDSSLIFDVDMATFTDNTGNVKTMKTDNVKSSTFEGYDGKTVNYAQLSAKEGGFLIEQSGYKENGKKITGNKQTTVEMWLKIDKANSRWPDWFLIKEQSAQFSAAYWGVEQSLTKTGTVDTSFNDQIFNKAFSGKANAPYQLTDCPRLLGVTIDLSEWNHYVFSRNIEEKDGKYYCTTTTYLNGMHLKDSTKVEIGDSTMKIDSDTATVYFGNPNLGKFIEGGIAEIKVYDTIKTADEVEALYKEDEKTFRDGLMVNIDPETLSDTCGTVIVKDGGNYFELAEKATWENPSSLKSVPYMKMEKKQGIGISSGENVSKIQGLDELSLDVWFKPYFTQGTWSKFITVGGKSGLWVETGLNGGGGSYILIKNGDTPLFQKNYNGICTDEWWNLIITRKYDTTAKTLEFTAYLNGEAMATAPVTISNVTAIDTNTSFEYSFGKGWHEYGNNNDSDYEGGFGKIKIYNRILNEKYVTTTYNKECATYGDMKKGLDLGFNKNGDNVSVSVKNGSSNCWSNTIGAKTFENASGNTVVYADFSTPADRFLEFDTGNNSTVIENSLNKDETTVSMWIKPENTKTTFEQPIFAFLSGNGNPKNSATWRMAMTSDGKLIQYHGGQTKVLENDISSYFGKWVNVVVTRNITDSGIVYKTYANGTLLGEKTQNGTVPKEVTIIFGTYENWGGSKDGENAKYQVFDNFQGGIAEVQIYSQAVGAKWAKNQYDTNVAKYTEAVEDKVTVTGVEFYSGSDGDTVNTFTGNENSFGAEFTLENDTNKAINCFIAVGLYDGNKLVDIQTTTCSVAVGGSTEQVEFESGFNNAENLSENAYIKAFVWYDGEENQMKPCEVESGVTMELTKDTTPSRQLTE